MHLTSILSSYAGINCDASGCNILKLFRTEATAGYRQPARPNQATCRKLTVCLGDWLKGVVITRWVGADQSNGMGRGSGHKILTREKFSPTKSQNLVRPLLPIILCLCVTCASLCLSDLPNFLQKGLRNYSSPTLAGVKLPLFCQFWQQQHVPQIRRCVRCLGTIIGSLVKLLRPKLRDAMIEVGTKRFLIRSAPTEY